MTPATSSPVLLTAVPEGSTARTPRSDDDADSPALRAPRVAAGLLGHTVVEVAIMGALFVLYNVGRVAIHGQESKARSHAALVRRIEELVHLPSESAIQDTIAGYPHLFTLANQYYVTLHFPVMLVFLLWGFLARPRVEYVWARNLLVTITFLGLAIHVAFPLAPPRMFPEWGFTDTMAVWGPSAYDGASAVIANQYAAMPSLHIGWALLIALVLLRVGPRPVALLAVLHAATTVLVVVITANHWWLDGIIAGSLLALALVVFPRPHTAPHVDTFRTTRRNLNSP